MKFLKRISFSLLLFPVVFMALGILLITIYDANKQLYNYSVDVKATVSACEYYSNTDHDGNSQEGYKIYVDYEYNGKKYSNVYWNSFVSKKSIGKAVDIRILPDNPSSVVQKSSLGVLFIGLGFLAVGVGLAFKMVPDSFSKEKKEEEVIFVKNRAQSKKVNARVFTFIPIIVALVFFFVGMAVTPLFYAVTIISAYIAVVIFEFTG